MLHDPLFVFHNFYLIRKCYINLMVILAWVQKSTNRHNLHCNANQTIDSLGKEVKKMLITAARWLHCEQNSTVNPLAWFESAFFLVKVGWVIRWLLSNDMIWSFFICNYKHEHEGKPLVRDLSPSTFPIKGLCPLLLGQPMDCHIQPPDYCALF